MTHDEIKRVLTTLAPELIRIGELYPDLQRPIPFASAIPNGPVDEDGEAEDGLFSASFEFKPLNWNSYLIPYEHHRIVEEYAAARERQEEAEEACAAARWNRPAAELAARAGEADPETVPRGGKLTPRQELFCEHYAAQPVAMRAAVLAGYSEESANTYGPRLLRNPLVLDRIAKLREERRLHYVVQRDTLHDKLEAVFFAALAEGNHAAAVAALRYQGALGGLSLRQGGAAARGAGTGEEPRAREKSGKVGVSRRQKSGKVGIGRAKKSGKVRESR